eukprot:5982640-Pyramimonas_sp.AAC.1
MVIDASSMLNVDAAGVQVLKDVIKANRAQDPPTTVLISGVRGDFRRKLAKSGTVLWQESRQESRQERGGTEKHPRTRRDYWWGQSLRRSPQRSDGCRGPCAELLANQSDGTY